MYITKVYTREEGLLTLQIDVDGNALIIRDQDLYVKELTLDASREEVGSVAISDLLSIINQTAFTDIAVMPIPTSFTFVDREFAYAGSLERIYLGYGYIYSYHNQFIFISNEIADYFRVSRGLPHMFKEVEILSYRKYPSVYLIEAKNGSQFLIPYWIIEAESTRDNPLIHFPPLRIAREEDLPEGLEFKDLEKTNIQMALETKQVGASYYLYLKDAFGTIYSSYINHAILKNMSPYSKKVKLLRGIEALSPQGDYLSYIEQILMEVGVLR